MNQPDINKSSELGLLAMIWATISLLPLSLVVERPWSLAPTLPALAAAAAPGIFCTAGALLLYFRLVRALGPTGVASPSYARAGVGVLLGILLLGEHFTIEVTLGLVLTILGVAAINMVPVATRTRAGSFGRSKPV